jgi:CDP-paratose 2-epimerase
MTKKVVVTGSAGLIGSEAVKFFCTKEFEVFGIDNDSRAYFFGKDASTSWNRELLEKQFKKQYTHYNYDIRNYSDLEKIFKKTKFDLIIHTAAQPSHDWAAKEPITDFTINANGTLNLLELTRTYSPGAVFIFTSTNKVYGDLPNELPLVELDTRYEIKTNHTYRQGIDETMSIDNSVHSIFGASKVAADILVQEYGKYFNMKTVCFRGGCLTGPAHSGAMLHGFLSYLVKCIAKGEQYTIFGYKGKQVRDNIHAFDLVNAFYHFYQNPKVGEVYNMGGGRQLSVSVLEAIEKIEKISHKKAHIKYKKDNRIGDHIWYISNVSKFKTDYPEWDYTYSLDEILNDIYQVFK